MSQITTVPQDVSQAGYQFNYALWTAGTVVTLVNVPWDSDYRNTVRTPAANGLDTWIDGRTDKVTIRQMKHNRLNGPVRIDLPFERAVTYNYIRASNPAQPISGSLPSTYYYFIKSVEYGAPNTTILNVQLDVWATFIRGTSLGRCYIERSHLGIANSRQQEERGRRYLTVPEGMDLGGEMEVAHVWEHKIATARSLANQTGTNYSIMVTATQDLEQAENAGTEDDAKIITADGSRLENLPNGGAVYFFRNPLHLTMFLRSNKHKAWVTQSITSIVAIPPIDDMQVPKTEITLSGVPAGGVYMAEPGSIPTVTQKLATNWTSELGLDGRYANLHKFKTYPYSAIELTSYSGQPLVMKPESMGSRDIDVAIMFHLNPGSSRVTFVPMQYNGGIGSNTVSDSLGVRYDSGEWLDFASTISNLPTFTTVNDSYSAFIASNKNQIAYQYKSASWDQQRAMQGAQTAYGQAQSGMELTGGMNNAGIRQRMAGTAQSNVTANLQGAVGAGQAAMGTVGSAGGGGNALGAAMGGASGMGGAFANTLITQQQNTEMMNINNSYANQSTAAQLRNQAYNQDTNMALAQSVSGGDYANAIAGIQAKVQDNQMLQPTTSGQIGGDAFTLATVGWSIFAKLKRLHGVAVSEIGEYWLRYGYRVNRWYTPPVDLLVCENFTYWQMKDATVFADGCPEEYRQTIRGILEKGVTVYANPDHIGRIDPLDNAPKAGISY